ncbi:hypothetical protein A1O7_07097 [Cladophialophora yegresii CBS 114405]|uniref:Uncharacterized protein n=1 Tax=Cladophialophora yegresii CBS 114405 TaxID=1182544 RepID=W9VMJ3_9EURO|nr:uncharacterized protein A1O7_07097 [Cladophialophora yegresii CBS 114405]EXJ56753.1 hypothetical protein A1O7_07097 [Cladophialophora yegresii CBS 114405]
MRFRDAPELPSPDKRKRWRSITLRLWCVPLLLLAEVALIVAIGTLFALSRQRTGFVDVGFEERSLDFSSFPGALRWGQGLLWTTFPVLIIGLYKLFRDAVVAALVVETPYIELARTSRDRPVKARKSVYLDYRSYFAIVACGKAWKNKHYFLSICLVLSFVEALGLVPLTARLFAAREELLPKEAAINVLSAFDTSAPLGTVDYGALMDAVSASWINESPLPRGTDGDFAFSRIEPTEPAINFTISAPTNASRLTMDCAEVPISSANPNVVDETDNFVTVSFSTRDRGCDIEGSIPAQTDGSDFLEAILTSKCPDGAGNSRIGFFYGAVSATGDLTSSILVSCIPTYWSAPGILTVVTTNSTFSDRVVETPRFDASAYDVHDLGIPAQQFEQGVMTVQTFNPATTSAGNTNAPLRLAELVVRRIEALGQPYTADTLINAVNRIYPAIYTILALTYFYPELAPPLAVTGTLAVPQNRLHVVPPVAIAMLVTLAILGASTAYLLFYLRFHPSILAEEPVGLLGAASLLRRSNIAEIIERYHRQDDFDGRLSRELPKSKEKKDVKKEKNGNKEKRKKKKKQHLDDQLKETWCWIERGERPHELIIKMGRPESECDEGSRMYDTKAGSGGAGEDEEEEDRSHSHSQRPPNRVQPPYRTSNGPAPITGAGGHCMYGRVPSQEQEQDQEAVYDLGQGQGRGSEGRPPAGPGLGSESYKSPSPNIQPALPTPTPSPGITGPRYDYDYGHGYGYGYQYGYGFGRNGGHVDGGFLGQTPPAVPGGEQLLVGVRRKPVHTAQQL